MKMCDFLFSGQEKHCYCTFLEGSGLVFGIWYVSGFLFDKTMFWVKMLKLNVESELK